jgi:hypothetical protein
MNGIKIRMSRFTDREVLISSSGTAEETCLSSSAMLVFPNQVPGILGLVPDYSMPVLLVRLTDWSGDNLVTLCGARLALALGGDGCVVDLASGFEDGREIESMRILARTVEEAHCLGLPVLAQIRFNEAGHQDALTDCLEIPLAAAEEIGVDAIIMPVETTQYFSPSYCPSVPLFLAGNDGLIRRFEL